MAWAKPTMNGLDKPFSQACENNKQPILDVLNRVFAQSRRVLEIGSGTGQHAVYFAPRLPHLDWFTSDMPHNHSGIAAWLAGTDTSNLYAPLPFTIGLDAWPLDKVDAVYTANTTHIMQPTEAQKMMQMVRQNLCSGGFFCQYGPFNFNGQYTSDSNQAFDQHLADQQCGGIRDVEELIEWAKPLNLIETIPMPANNFVLVWQKS